MDVMICSTKRDYNKLKYVVESLRKHIKPQPESINVVHDDQNPPPKIQGVNCISESEVLPLDKEAAKGFNRPSWIYQQFLKLFNFRFDEYLVVDSDIIFNKDIEIYNKEDGKPYFFFGRDQHHEPYFKYSRFMFDVHKQYPSFICEIMLFQQKFCEELLQRFWYNFHTDCDEYDRWCAIKDLYSLTTSLANNDFIPSEYEIYGNYVMSQEDSKPYHKFLLNSQLDGKYKTWTDKEIEQKINRCKEENYHVFTIHTWV